MTTLAANKPRGYTIGDRNEFTSSTTAVFEGAAVGLNPATGATRPLTAGDIFVGFAERANRDPITNGLTTYTRVIESGKVELPISGAVATDIGLPVYATDDDTFSFSPAGGVFIGFVHRVPSSGKAIVKFDASSFRDPHEGWVAEAKAANFTTQVTDSGKLILITADAVVVTLAATAAGGVTKFMNLGAYGTIGFSLSPNASDKVQGPGIAGTDNKDLILTKATARRGDFVELVWGQADGPVIRQMRGIWVTEA